MNSYQSVSTYTYIANFVTIDKHGVASIMVRQSVKEKRVRPKAIRLEKKITVPINTIYNYFEAR